MSNVSNCIYSRHFPACKESDGIKPIPLDWFLHELCTSESFNLKLNLACKLKIYLNLIGQEKCIYVYLTATSHYTRDRLRFQNSTLDFAWVMLPLERFNLELMLARNLNIPPWAVELKTFFLVSIFLFHSWWICCSAGDVFHETSRVYEFISPFQLMWFQSSCVLTLHTSATISVFPDIIS